MSEFLFEFMRGFVHFLVYLTITAIIGGNIQRYRNRKSMEWFAERVRRMEEKQQNENKPPSGEESV